MENNLSEEEIKEILQEKYKRKGRPYTHRPYYIFYGKTKTFKKKIYARNIEEAVEIFKNNNNYVPKFARDHWHKEVWANYTNDKATTETTENS